MGKPKVNCGGELLIKKRDWVPEVDLQGHESKVLNSPLKHYLG